MKIHHKTFVNEEAKGVYQRNVGEKCSMIKELINKTLSDFIDFGNVFEIYYPPRISVNPFNSLAHIIFILFSSQPMDLALKGFGGPVFAQGTFAEVPGSTAQNKRWVLASGVTCKCRALEAPVLPTW